MTRLHLVLAASALIIASATEAIRSAPAEDALASIDDPQTLSQLLQWSLANQDLDALHQKAEAIRHGDGGVPQVTPPGVLSADGNAGELSADGTYSIAGAALLPLGGGAADASIRPTVQRMTPERLAELKVLQKQLMPDMVGLMREALASAIDESLPVDEREAALLKLEDHASDIDQAHDLMIIGGLVPVVQLLGSDVPPLQTAAAWVIGSAVQNHRELQLHVLAIPAAMPSLLALARLHTSAEEKALQALEQLVAVALLPVVVTSPEASTATVADEADCALSAVRAALHRYRDRCDAAAGGAPDMAPDSTEAEGDEDDGQDDGPSACEAAMSLDQQLERMMLRP